MLNTNVSASAADTLARVPSNGSSKLPVQVVVGAGITASIVLSGRVSPDAPWTALSTVSASGIVALDFVPYLKADVTITAGGGGANTVQVIAPGTSERIAKTEKGFAPVPQGLTRPQITGRPVVGQSVTADDGTWANSPTSYRRQWLRNRVPISGATTSSYAIAVADAGFDLSYEVVAINANGESIPFRSRRTDAVVVGFSVTPVARTFRGLGQGLRQNNDGLTQYATTRTRKRMYSNAPFRRVRAHIPVFAVLNAKGTGSMVNDVLTITTATHAAFRKGATVTGGTIPANTEITEQLTIAAGWKAGGAGTYRVNKSLATDTGTITVTGPIGEALLQVNGALTLKFQQAIEQVFAPVLTGLLPRLPFTWGGSTVATYDYSTWDENNGWLSSDVLELPSDILADAYFGLHSAVSNPNGSSVPYNRLGSRGVFDRNEGFDFVISNGDFVADGAAINATSYSPVSTSILGSSLMFTPGFLTAEMPVDVPSIGVMGTSIASTVGEGDANGPTGYGDTEGSARGNSCWIERGLYEVAKVNAINLAKPSDRASYLVQHPDNWRYRKQALVLAKVDGVINEHVQNDNAANAYQRAWAANTAYNKVGQTIYTSGANSSFNLFLVTGLGTSGSSAPAAPASAGSNVTDGTATLEFLGSAATTDIRASFAAIGANLLINRAVSAATGGKPIAQTVAGPFTSSGDQFKTYAQTKGFAAEYGWEYNTRLVATNGASVGASRIIDHRPFIGGSSTVTGGPDDGMRFWKTDGVTPYLFTGDGIHPNSRGALEASQAITRDVVPA